MPRLQHEAVSLLSDVLPHGSPVAEEAAPTWLVRPGRAECLDVWPLVQDVYRSLTDHALPEQMPERERRRLDAVITYTDGRQRVLEVDERQHFTSSRMITLDFYDGRVTHDGSVRSPSVPVSGHTFEVREQRSLFVVEVPGKQRCEHLEIAAQPADAVCVVATQVPCCRADLEDEHRYLLVFVLQARDH
jgi:hypothetical protein